MRQVGGRRTLARTPERASEGSTLEAYRRVAFMWLWAVQNRPFDAHNVQPTMDSSLLSAAGTLRSLTLDGACAARIADQHGIEALVAICRTSALHVARRTAWRLWAFANRPLGALGGWLASLQQMVGAARRGRF